MRERKQNTCSDPIDGEQQSVDLVHSAEMLRSSLLRASRPNFRAIELRNRPDLVQGYIIASFASGRRLYSGKKPDETILPGSQSAQQAAKVPSPPELVASITPNQKPPPPQSVPKVPTSPQELAPVASAGTTPNPASPTPTLGTGTAQVAPPPVPPKKKSRFFRYLLNLIILSTLTYGIGVYYALTSDNWHDFFTEYVPFGEEAVAYFEEREFRRRFLNRPQQESRLHPQVRGEAKVTIPGRAGVEVKKVEEADLASKGRHTSAVEPHPQTVGAQQKDREISKPTESSTHQLLPKDSKPAPKEQPKPTASKSAAEPATTPAKVQPVEHIDNLQIAQASEPVVQDIVKILNDLITVVNADNAGNKYGSAIDKAKGGLSKVVSDLEILKQSQKKQADEQVKGLHEEFDKAAKELLRRSEEHVQEMEIRWREEYENERSSMAKQLESKLDAELSTAKQVYDQMLENELLKQSIALRKNFAKSVQDTVEAERDGRLSKLDELSSNVSELQRLTGEWNSVVDSTMHTQHLLVAVEAVRANLETADRPRPFISELAALKEVAAENPLVNAAIASINPTAYQKGIQAPGQLIDRFRRVSSEVRKAALLPDNAGVTSHAASYLLSKVMFKKGGLPVGDDVESILTRAEALLEEGNLEQAVREVNSLTGWAKTLSRDWLGECRRVLEVQQALDVISTEARLRSLLVE
ncbi:formation of crista junctions protein 1 [Microthyrium microscopicum]|uniref:MICOS complex subunit MIC60 n=1 Tax=Microthyrium microscopicum TaxID=703497 RepID=A0A6A6TWP5_9PEZI|nr:formation of crista junctions protein 1 [Microthyrium microscopicum]